jgi:hypothetical protein
MAGLLFGNQRHSNELQSDQRAGRRADDNVEVLPSGKCSHAAKNTPIMFARKRKTLTAMIADDRGFEQDCQRAVAA